MSAVRKFFLSPVGKFTAIALGFSLYYLVFIMPLNTLGGYLGYPLLDYLFDSSISFIDLALLIAFISPLGGRLIYQKLKNRLSRHIMAITMTWAGVCFFLFFPTLALMLSNALFSFSENTLQMVTNLFLFLASLLAAYGIINANLLFVKDIQIQDKRIPSDSTAIQLSDVHIGSRSNIYIKRLIKRVNQLKPDKIFITGDLVDLSAVGEEDLKLLKNFEAPVYFVTGNHDRYVNLDRLLPILKIQGFNILRNETLILDDFDLTGIDDAESPKQVKRVLENMDINTERFNILLYHRPKGFGSAAKKGIDLMLAGHTHNGQIVPFNFMVKQVFKDIKGTIKRHNAILHVSTGSSTWGPIMRIGSLNEITHIHFKRG